MTYIVLLNWNGWQDTINCIASIYENVYEPFNIVLLDNHSSDESVEKIQKYLQGMSIKYSYVNENDLDKVLEKSFIFIQNNGNYGFAKGINVGLKYCLSQKDCDDIWLLNTDAIIDKNTQKELKESLYQKNKNAFSGSVIRYYENPDVIQTIGGGRFYPILANGKLFYKNSDISILDSIEFDRDVEKLDYIMGASILIKKKALEDIGLFDENFFLYAEELDLCKRAKKKGWCLAVSRNSFIYHKDSASTKDKKGMYFYLLNKSNAYYVKKHYGSVVALFGFVSNVFMNLLSNTKRKYFKDAVRGYIDGYKFC